MTAIGAESILLDEAEWRNRRRRYVERLRERTSERTERMRRGVKHPVNDFLFEYYSYRPAHLLRWSPGPDVVLEGIGPEASDWPGEAVAVPGGTMIPAAGFPGHRISYLDWAIDYLERTGERAPNWNCFGLHEWAMLYRAPAARHSTPLRLSADGIAAAVDELGLRCTHYDAYRFFTPESAPKNRIPLSRAATPQNDQPACIHVVMDLYKFAHKIAPWIDSDIVGDAFLLACEARQLDMRASPYDLREYGLEAIPIETKEGREVYLRGQRELAAAGVPIRKRLLEAHRSLRMLKAGSAHSPLVSGL